MEIEMTHSRKRIDNPVCKDCGTSDNLKKDKHQTSGYRSICYKCDSKQQRIKKNGHDTGGKYNIPICKDCGEKDVDKLCPDNRCYMGVKRLCKSCAAKRVRGYRQKTDKYRKSKQRSDFNLRIKVLNYYGHRCTICGEHRYEFLAIDHINNDGAAHKRSLGNKDSSSVLRDIIKNNYPNTYQILCHNCNASKQYYKRNPILLERTQYEQTEGYFGEGI